MNKQNIKIITSDELVLMINEYSKFFSSEINDYINSLFGLEISVLDDFCCDKKAVELLNSSLFFRKLAIYNIFHRLVSLMCREGINVKDKDNCLGGVFLRLPLNTFSNIFNFQFTTDCYSTIVLNETIVDENFRNKRLEWLKFLKKYERKPSEYNLSTLSQSLHISRIEREIRELESFDEIDEKLRCVMEFQQRFSDVFLQDNGISKEDFVEDIIDYNDKSPKMMKTLVKKYPHTVVAREIRYY